MSLSGHLEKVRDLFIIGYRTGLRVSDTVELSGLICIDDTEKIGESVYIPIHWQVRAILEKHSGLPPIIPDKKLNAYLKDLCIPENISNHRFALIGTSKHRDLWRGITCWR